MTPFAGTAEATNGTMADVLMESLSTGSDMPRDVALAAFRRHLVRIQTHIRAAFEDEHLTGLIAARRLGTSPRATRRCSRPPTCAGAMCWWWMIVSRRGISWARCSPT